MHKVANISSKYWKTIQAARTNFYLLKSAIDVFIRNYKNIKISVQETDYSGKETKVEADDKIHDIFADWIGLHFDDQVVVGEEAMSGVNKKYDWKWYIDPIDGTTPFSRGIDEWGIIIALTYKEMPVFSWIYFPYANILYEAVKGCGSFKNGIKVSTSGIVNVERAIISSVYMDTIERQSVMVGMLWNKSLWAFVGRSLAKDFSELSEGKIDVSVCFNCASWEYKALSLLVSEAGGICMDFNGKVFNADAMGPKNFIAFANRSLAKKASKLIKTPSRI